MLFYILHVFFTFHFVCCKNQGALKLVVYKIKIGRFLKEKKFFI